REAGHRAALRADPLARLSGTMEFADRESGSASRPGMTPSSSHRPIGEHLGRHIPAEPDLADRLYDVIAQKLREARLATVVHVQAVGGHKALHRAPLLLVPFTHHLEAREDADMAESGDRLQETAHGAGAFGVLGARRRILRIDQNHIATSGLDAR